MNKPTKILILSTIISYMSGNVLNCQTGQPDNTRLIDLDWTGKSTEECKTYIQNAIEMTNNQDDPFFKPINDLCLPDNQVVSIDILCSNTLQTTQSILRGFFFLDRGLQEPENQIYKKNQCTCQNKCNIQESSAYTFKIHQDNNVGYFTTKNSCMAFCMNGYEIYPTSYIVNTFPDPSIDNQVLKKGLDECNMHLNHTIPKFKQIAIMHAEFCHAFALCEKFKEIYNADILLAETCIYGFNFNDDHTLTDEEKFWIGQSDENLQSVSTRCLHFNIPQNSSSTLTEAESCFNVFANNNISIEERNETHCFSRQLQFIDVDSPSVNICEDDHDPIGPDTTLFFSKKFFIVNTLLIQCLMGESNPVSDPQKDITSCICKDPVSFEVEKFDTSCIDLFYIENNISSFNLENNFSFSNIINTESPHVSFDSTGACSCPFSNFFDYLAFQESCALCFINGRNSTFEVLSTSERFLFLQSQHISPPSLITNQTKEECESQNGFNGDDINTACIDGNDVCLLKIIKDTTNNSFQPLFIKQNESLQCILNQLNDMELNNNNIIFDCPLNENCSNLTCSIEYVEKCKEDDNFSQFCADFVNDSCSDCEINNVSLNTCVIDNGQAFLFSEYDACSLNCINQNIKLCKENENCLHLTNDENTLCQEIFSISQCEIECQSRNNTDLYCSFNSSVEEDCISEIDGCLEICNGNNNRVLCTSPDLSCFQSYCNDFISTNPSCKCLDCVNPTLEFCKNYDSNLTCDDYCTNKFCIKTTITNEILYDLEEITYICDNNPSSDNINLKQCENCITAIDCCEEFCDFPEMVCSIINGLAIYADEQSLCDASCSNKSVSFPSNDIICCEDFCENHSATFCLYNEFNDSVILFDDTDSCQNHCNDIEGYSITDDSTICVSCTDTCFGLDDINNIYCEFDENIESTCYTAFKKCQKECSDGTINLVNCENTETINCFKDFCIQFNPSFDSCECFNCNNSIFEPSIEICTQFNSVCNCTNVTEGNFCVRNIDVNDNWTFELDAFTCQNNDNVIVCNECIDSSECCEKFCNFTEGKCVKFENELTNQFKTADEFCNLTCRNESFIEQPTLNNCCEDLCNNHFQDFCLTNNDDVILFTPDSDCSNICADIDLNSYEITNDDNKCKTCEEKCDDEDDFEEIYCFFDEDINKICINSKENCLKNCNNELNEVVKCEETNEGEDNFEYNCLVNFCNDFNKSFCDCLACNNSSLDLCKAYIPNCSCNDCLDVIYCKQKNLNDIVSYERFTNLECCGSNPPEETNDIRVESCITCNDNNDCCEHFCNFTEDKCAKINLENKFYKSHEICKKSCDESISFEIQDKIEPCCKDICINHSNALCYFANNRYSLFDTQNCEDLCNDLENANDFKIIDNYSLCTNTMTCEELAETKPDGKYCNSNFDVFDSFLSYCNSVNGVIDEFDYVLCTKAKCNKRQCKKLFFDKTCKNDDKKQLSVVGEHGECFFFNNREDLEDEFSNMLPEWKIFKCKYSCEQKCLQSIEYKSFYISRYIPKCDEEKAYYCYRNKIISFIEYTFHRKCLQKPDDYFKKCDDYRCKNTRCKIYDKSSDDTSHDSDENTILDKRFIWNSNMNLTYSFSIPKSKRKNFIKFKDYQYILKKRKHKQNYQILQNIISITLQQYGCYLFNGKRYVKKIRKDYCSDTQFLSLCASMNVNSFKECKEECQKLV